MRESQTYIGGDILKICGSVVALWLWKTKTNLELAVAPGL